MIINLMWLVVIVAAAVSQWAIIEKKMRRPNKKLWFGIRALVAAGFIVWYWLDGQYLVWAIPFLVVSFAMLFPTLLNIFRKGKPLLYLSAKGSKYDAFVLRTFGSLPYWGVLFVLFLTTVGFQLVYNHFDIHSWAELW